MKIAFRSASLTNYEEVARRVGLDPMRVLEEFGLPAASLEDPELRIAADATRQLLESSAERSHTENFGLLMAEGRRLSDLGPLGLLVREQPTVRLAMEAFVRHAGRLSDALFWTSEEGGEFFVLRAEIVVGGRGSARQATELAIGIAYRMLKSLLGPNWRARRVCFVHEAPLDLSVHDRVFGPGIVEFGKDFNGVVFSRRDLELRNAGADPGFARMARAMIEADATTDSRSTTADVRHLVIQRLGSGPCSIEYVAEQLGVDRRTVHRRLAREGQTFSTILDGVRAELADRYLRDGHRSLADISLRLGFSTPSSFSRWFRMRFGATPSSRIDREAVH